MEEMSGPIHDALLEGRGGHHIALLVVSYTNDSHPYGFLNTLTEICEGFG
jgi:hypothetical protein